MSAALFAPALAIRRVATLVALGALVAGPAQAQPAGVAAFDRMASVLTSPRCENCHTSTGFPRQGDDRHPHRQNVQRGPDGHGVGALTCNVCHGQANNAASGVPGAKDTWKLAPLSMAWEGRTPRQVCEELKDPARNGGRSGVQVINHLNTHLVQWAWAPGTDARGQPRATPPIPYEAFLVDARAWVAAGRPCPRS